MIWRQRLFRCDTFERGLPGTAVKNAFNPRCRAITERASSPRVSSLDRRIVAPANVQTSMMLDGLFGSPSTTSPVLSRVAVDKLRDFQKRTAICAFLRSKRASTILTELKPTKVVSRVSPRRLRSANALLKLAKTSSLVRDCKAASSPREKA